MARFQDKLDWTTIPVDKLPEEIAVKYVEAHTLLGEVKAALESALAKPGQSVKVAMRDPEAVAVAYAKSTSNGKSVMSLADFMAKAGVEGRRV